MPVHARHLQLEVEIGNRPQPADQDAGLQLGEKIDQQPGKTLDPGVGVRGQHLAQDLHTFVDLEERLGFGGVVEHRHHHLVEKLQAAKDQIQMTGMERIERSRINPDFFLHPRSVAAAADFASFTSVRGGTLTR